MSNSSHAVFERYAKALFALSTNAHDAVEADLAALRKLLAENAELADFVANPLIPRRAKAEGMDAVLAKGNANALTRQFVSRLALNGRLDALAGVASEFDRLLGESRGEVVADFVSAKPLSAEQTKALAEAVAAKLGKRVRVQASVDPELLGGVRIHVGGQMIDYTLKTQLARLERELKSNLN